MRIRHLPSLVTVLFVLAAATAAVVPAQTEQARDGVKLVRVPERVVLPPVPGTNLLVEARPTRAPDRIWLARAEDQIGGVPLSSSGDGTWQVNLADRRVLRLLPAGHADGTLQVFARFGGRTVASAPIAWTRRELPRQDVRCLLVSAAGPRREVEAGHGVWFDPATVERIEILGARAPQARVIGRAGGVDLPFTYREAERRFELQLSDGLRDSMQVAGFFDVEVRVGEALALFPNRVIPDRLRGEEDREFVVLQRRRGDIPGTRGWLNVRLGDITMGRVAMTIRDAAGGIVAAPRLVDERGFVEFELGTERCVLRIDNLVNRLIGEDHAELRVLPAKDHRPDVIALLIARVEASAGITFLREGKEYDSATAAQLLRAKVGSVRGPRPTPAQFIELGSRSRTTGNPYRVRLADGSERPAKAWLTELLREVEKAAGQAGGERAQDR